MRWVCLVRNVVLGRDGLDRTRLRTSACQHPAGEGVRWGGDGTRLVHALPHRSKWIWSDNVGRTTSEVASLRRDQLHQLVPRAGFIICSSFNWLTTRSASCCCAVFRLGEGRSRVGSTLRGRRSPV